MAEAIFILVIVAFGLFCAMMCQRDDKHSAQNMAEAYKRQLRDTKRKLEYVISCFGDDGERTAKHWDEVVKKAESR